MIPNKAYYDQMAAGCFCLPSKAGTARCSICWTMRRPCYLTSQACAPCPGLICRFNHKILKPLPFLSWPDMQVTTRINLTFEPFAPYLGLTCKSFWGSIQTQNKKVSRPKRKASLPASSCEAAVVTTRQRHEEVEHETQSSETLNIPLSRQN